MRYLWLASLWLLLVAPSALRAATVAVLPFAPGDGPVQGLGRGLSGLFVADLSRLPELSVLPSERLRATSWPNRSPLDAKTARRVGRELDVDWLLTGSYAVSGPRLVIAARVIDARSGKPLADADARGAVDRFVAVQKTVAEALLDELRIPLSPTARRTLMVEAPTESFAALVAWGVGLERAESGDAAGARTAHARAIEADPGFAAPREALAALGEPSPLRTSSQRDELNQLAIERFADAGDAATDVGATAGFALRLEALRDAGQHCERADEMRRYLTRVDYRVREPGSAGAFASEVRRLASEIGADNRTATFSESARLFASTGAFVLDHAHRPYAGDQRGLVASMADCMAPERFLEELNDLVATLNRERALGGAVSPDDALTWRDAADIAWALGHARRIGPGDALTVRLDALLGRHSRGSAEASRVLGLVETIRDEAAEREATRRRRLGHSEDELVKLAAGLLGRDPSVVTLANPYCRYVADHAETTVGPPLAEIDPTTGQRPDHAVDRLAAQLGTLRDFGCIRGVPARFRSVHEAWASLRSAIDPGPPNPDPACGRSLAQARGLELDEALVEELPPSYRGFNGWLASHTYWNLVRAGCLPWE